MDVDAVDEIGAEDEALGADIGLNDQRGGVEVLQ